MVQVRICRGYYVKNHGPSSDKWTDLAKFEKKTSAPEIGHKQFSKPHHHATFFYPILYI